MYLNNLAQAEKVRRRSSVAEQLFCKQLAVSSNLTVGSRGGCRSGQSELAVNQSGFALRRFESFTAHHPQRTDFTGFTAGFPVSRARGKPKQVAATFAWRTGSPWLNASIPCASRPRSSVGRAHSW